MRRGAVTTAARAIQVDACQVGGPDIGTFAREAVILRHVAGLAIQVSTGCRHMYVELLVSGMGCCQSQVASFHGISTSSLCMTLQTTRSRGLVYGLHSLIHTDTHTGRIRLKNSVDFCAPVCILVTDHAIDVLELRLRCQCIWLNSSTYVTTATAIPVAGDVATIGIYGSGMLSLQPAGLVDHVWSGPLPLVVGGVKYVQGVFIVTFKTGTGTGIYQIIVSGVAPATPTLFTTILGCICKCTDGASAGCINLDVARHDLS
jgi:hypothetical protein